MPDLSPERERIGGLFDDVDDRDAVEKVVAFTNPAGQQGGADAQQAVAF